MRSATKGNCGQILLTFAIENQKTAAKSGHTVQLATGAASAALAASILPSVSASSSAAAAATLV